MLYSANGFAEAHRRASTAEENEFLRELLYDGNFASPRQLQSSPATSLEEGFESNSDPNSPSGPLKRSSQEMDVSFSQICFDNQPYVTRMQSQSSNSCADLSVSVPDHSPRSAASATAIVSPPRVFVQEFAYLSQPFFHDKLPSDTDMREMRPETATVSFLTSCFPPASLPMLSMPPYKKTKTLAVTTSTSNEKQQVRCIYPDCPNLRRSAGFCNRHSGKMCSMSGCMKSALSRGKCPEHGGGSRCKNVGCSKFAQTRGLCKSHGGGRQCNVSGCTKNAHQNRLCRSHGGGKRCDYTGCPKWAQRSGYCCAHTKMSSSSDAIPSVDSQHTDASMPASAPSPTWLSPHRLFSLRP
ncbi:unnamed protein product [Hyaloperonospora brassicae]|uniref:WRKY19-like zinc finger domain-containing protein n=1 Tax=Hyaloperonospora brassicae TaxID=162125 RepID=A0AAV0SUM0_HYABA|nr:unnamed protein product [Hyaloperonospora brassicae]